MISTILKINFLNLRRDRAAFFLTFILPITFFSIFAMIFGRMDRDVRDNKIKIAVTDRDQTEKSRSLIAALQKEQPLEVTVVTDDAAARTAVHDGRFAAGIVILEGCGARIGNFFTDTDCVEVVYDAANPLAQNAVSGFVQGAAMMTAAPEVRAQFGRGLVRIRSIDVREKETRNSQQSMISYYAAGVSVMFLLFSMAAAGGALLDETESGTLERLLSTRATMMQILLGKWAYLTMLGILEVTVMFVWAAIAFHLELFTAGRIAGASAMAVVTAAAAAGFGLVLATACTSRAQLNGISRVVILVMSALGGSMIPRFVMPKFMDTAALFTFNGWALDGFLKVFWYNDIHATVAQSLASLIPQLAMLTALAVAFVGIARTLAKRWETM
ncbi:MAG TPA: ABC transporter permease [Terriglobia bacterium]|nr:ABC transporter permease [Terriglobia bacterium]